EAIIYFTKSLEIDDKFIDSYYYRGYCLIQKGMFELAYNDLRQCILLSPQHAGAISLFNQYFASKK
ncbi:MAG: tetratricopeptide repeat protein, partial [Bacteroidota bacterium]